MSPFTFESVAYKLLILNRIGRAFPNFEMVSPYASDEARTINELLPVTICSGDGRSSVIPDNQEDETAAGKEIRRVCAEFGWVETPSVSKGFVRLLMRLVFTDSLLAQQEPLCQAPSSVALGFTTRSHWLGGLAGWFAVHRSMQRLLA